MSDAVYLSPIAPGRTWYQDSCGERPQYQPLTENIECDVAIVGGGYCGLSAALTLAEGGTRVCVIDACRFGDGASGRNGGQMGSGQRAGVLELEKQLGYERSRALWDLAESGKKALLATAERHGFDAGFQPGQLSPMHRRRYEKELRVEIDTLNSMYDYDAITYLDEASMANALGSTHYFGGARDSGTGHIHPLKYLIGLAAAAAQSGVQLFENTKLESIQHSGRFVLRTTNGTITADKCILALNGYHRDIRSELASRVLPIQSFIGATVPLDEFPSVLPNGEAVDDSRFVVRYFRKSKDNRLLFGGREAYGRSTPGDIERAIRRQITEIYPALSEIEITHAWGGNVAITMPRMPFVRELEPGLWTAGGFSGHGVVMANHTGRLIGEKLLGRSADIELLQQLDIPEFPGGTLFRNPLKVLALTWYSLLDRV